LNLRVQALDGDVQIVIERGLDRVIQRQLDGRPSPWRACGWGPLRRLSGSDIGGRLLEKFLNARLRDLLREGGCCEAHERERRRQPNRSIPCHGCFLPFKKWVDVL
jgi:hypothetical protein